MAGELTRVGQQHALQGAFKAATQTAATVYLALCTGDPGKAPANPGAINELSVAGYARQAIATGNWSGPTNADPSVLSNGAVITFGPFTGDPAEVTHCALVTSASGATGTVQAKWTLDVAKDAAVNESIQFAIGALSMSAR